MINVTIILLLMEIDTNLSILNMNEIFGLPIVILNSTTMTKAKLLLFGMALGPDNGCHNLYIPIHHKMMSLL